MRTVTPGAAQMVAAELEPIGGEELFGPRIVERRPFELEEQQLRLDRGRLFLHLLKQRAAHRVGGVG